MILIFSVSTASMMFVGYISFENSQKLAYLRAQRLLNTSIQQALSEAPEPNAAKSVWQSWLNRSHYLKHANMNSILANKDGDIVASLLNIRGKMADDRFTDLREITRENKNPNGYLQLGDASFIWDKIAIPNTPHTLHVFQRTGDDDFSVIFKQLVVPTIIAMGIALWVSVWGAIILSRLLTKAREHEELDALVKERTAELEEQRERAESANLLKSHLITTMSHELRTPLTAMIGSLRLLMETDIEDNAKSKKQLVDIAWRNSNHLATLVDSIFDVERFRVGAVDLDLKTLYLEEFVRKFADENEGYAREHNFKIVSSIPATKTKVLGDSARLMQVMNNLLSNASKFSPKGETVLVSVEPFKTQVKVSVSDNGRGVDDDIKGSVFGQFVRGENKDSRNLGGTGLGLFICKTIITAHGGTINFESNEDRGSTFYFILPTLKS